MMKNNDSKLLLEKTHDHSGSDSPKLTVVLIHGIASDSSAYNSALEYIEAKDTMKDIRFVTFDLLGSGKSQKDDSLNYDYADQLTALENSIAKLNLGTPLVLVGHSMGTFIVARYAKEHPGEVKELILLSPPVFTKRDFLNPAFPTAIKMFKEAVSVKHPEILEDKAFTNSLDKIVLDKNNYKVLKGLTLPITLIYGAKDQIIASHNLPKLLKEKSNFTAIKTNGRHGITRDKYQKLPKILERIKNA